VIAISKFYSPEHATLQQPNAATIVRNYLLVLAKRSKANTLNKNAWFVMTICELCKLNATAQSLLSPMLPQHWHHLWIAITVLIRVAAVIAAINFFPSR